MTEKTASGFYKQRQGDLVHVFDTVIFPIPLIYGPKLNAPRITTLSVDEMNESWITVSHEQLRKCHPDMMQRLDLATKDYMAILEAANQDLDTLTLREIRSIVETHSEKGNLHVVPKP